MAKKDKREASAAGAASGSGASASPESAPSAAESKPEPEAAPEPPAAAPEPAAPPAKEPAAALASGRCRYRAKQNLCFEGKLFDEGTELDAPPALAAERPELFERL